MNVNVWKMCLAVGLLFLLTTVRAELIDRGDGLIYDTVLDITWLQDANYALTSGYDCCDVDGGCHEYEPPDFCDENFDPSEMTWYQAVKWADQLSYQGLDDWRLASISVSAGIPTGVMTKGSSVSCFTESEEACRDNELGYMFVHYLGGWPADDLRGDQISVDGVNLYNIQYGYWSNTSYINYFYAFAFFFGGGGYFEDGKTSTWAAWAVRDGDVDDVQCVIPEDLTGLTVKVRDDTVYLSWDESEGATRYHIYRSIDGSDFRLLYDVGGTEYEDPLGSNWKTIEYYVVAVSTCGASAPSEIVQIKNTKGGGGKGRKS